MFAFSPCWHVFLRSSSLSHNSWPSFHWCAHARSVQNGEWFCQTFVTFVKALNTNTSISYGFWDSGATDAAKEYKCIFALSIHEGLLDFQYSLVGIPEEKKSIQILSWPQFQDDRGRPANCGLRQQTLPSCPGAGAAAAARVRDPFLTYFSIIPVHIRNFRMVKDEGVESSTRFHFEVCWQRDVWCSFTIFFRQHYAVTRVWGQHQSRRMLERRRPGLFWRYWRKMA